MLRALEWTPSPDPQSPGVDAPRAQAAQVNGSATKSYRALYGHLSDLQRLTIAGSLVSDRYACAGCHAPAQACKHRRPTSRNGAPRFTQSCAGRRLKSGRYSPLNLSVIFHLGRAFALPRCFFTKIRWHGDGRATLFYPGFTSTGTAAVRMSEGWREELRRGAGLPLVGDLPSTPAAI